MAGLGFRALQTFDYVEGKDKKDFNIIRDNLGRCAVVLPRDMCFPMLTRPFDKSRAVASLTHR